MHLHCVVGTLIVGTALSQLHSDKGTQFVGTLPFEQRPPSLTDAQMSTNRIGIGTQIDRVCNQVEKIHIVEVSGRTPATGKDNVFKLRHLVQHTPFELAKTSFAFFGEDGRNTLVESFLDIPIEIIEAQTQAPGEVTPDGGFAHAHVADQSDALHGLYLLLFFVVRRRAVDLAAFLVVDFVPVSMSARHSSSVSSAACSARSLGIL